MARDLALVTGASGGLGIEFAKLLAADGFDLAIVARSGDKLAAIASDLRSRDGIAVRTVAADLGVADAAAKLVAEIPDCDVLVNNAGFANNGRFDMLPVDDLREELLLNVLTLADLTRRYLPGMRARRRGRQRGWPRGATG